jgi:hypothetical protein
VRPVDTSAAQTTHIEALTFSNFDEPIPGTILLSELVLLKLQSKQLNDLGFVRLCCLQSLRELHILHAFSLSDAALTHLARLKNLEVLFLRGPQQMSDATFQMLCWALSRLQELDLSYAEKLTAAAYKNLPLLHRLHSLVLNFVYLNDKIVKDVIVVEPLKHTLEFLDVKRTRCTTKIEKLLPRCQIEFDFNQRQNSK